jgi:GT2 family glycosyltransferase
MSKTNPIVSIVILNWNRPKDTLECIKSVKNISYKNTEIIVVDNGSTDDSTKILSKVKGIILIKNQENKGFTGGHIDGFNVAKGEYIFILNNDTVVDKKYIDIALEIMKKDKNIGAVGGRSYAWDRSNPVFDTRNRFYSYQNINPVSAEAIFSTTDTGEIISVNNISGSAAVIRRSVIEKVGYFYEPFFAYYEEADLFARIKSAGYKVLYCPNLVIWHKSGASSNSYFQYYQLFKNRFIFAMRNFDNGYIFKFIKNYCKVGVTSTIFRFKKSNNQILHKAFSRAFIHNILYLPLTIHERLIFLRTSGFRNASYNELIQEDSIGISLVIDLSDKSLDKINEFTNYYSELKDTLHRPLDVVLCVRNCSNIDGSVRYVNISSRLKKSALNIGWLSSKYKYICFTNSKLSANAIDQIRKGALLLSRKKAWIISTPNNSHTVLSKTLLTNSGGLTGNIWGDKNKKTLELFSYFWNKKRILGNINLKSYSEDQIKHVRVKVHCAKDENKTPTTWNRILEKNYRIYQLRNLTRWLTSRKIALYLKAARCKNLVIYTLKLDRAAIAIEMQHIRNEYMRVSFLGVNLEKQQIITRKKIRTLLVKNSWKNIPVFIICRDRLESLKILVDKLENYGLTNIIFIDNDSAYPELIKYFVKTRYQLIKTCENIGHTVPWSGGIIKTLYPEDVYIVTDPDVIPADLCPNDFIQHILELHLKFPNHLKIGLGLKIDDLPDSYVLKESVIAWERQFWKKELVPGVYEAGIDTTFAVYKPYTYKYFINPSIRTGGKYVARHMPWYQDSSKKLSREEDFYRLRVNSNITSWNVESLPERYKKELNK